MERLIVIKSLEELADLKLALKDASYIAYDTETTSLEKDAEIIGFSVATDCEEGYYVVISYWDAAQQKLRYLETKDGAKDFIQSLVGKNLIMHNAVFDCEKTADYFGVDLMPSVHTDSLLLGHLLNENRSNGLKERAVELWGESSADEQRAMKESVHKNGGVLTKALYELYKADADLIAHYGAKDAILTMKVFYHDSEQLLEDESLCNFFYEETMPLLRGPTYQLNTEGLKVSPEALQKLRGELEADCMEAKAFIEKETLEHVKEKYPGTGKTNHFNIGSCEQRAWLLFEKLGNEFNTLTDAGRELCAFLGIKVPYAPGAKKEFIRLCNDNLGREWKKASFNLKTGKTSRPKTVKEPWKYMTAGKQSLAKLAPRYKWVARLLEYNKDLKLLNTYVCGIQVRMKYNIIRPQFLQHGTTSGRYASRNPNFQNLPRKDKRVKACIVSRPGKVFVGADYSQLEPRVFAAMSGDERLLACFASGDDFYSVIGSEIFDKPVKSLKKDHEEGFAVKYPALRDAAKVLALAAAYGTTAFKMAPELGKTTMEAEEVVTNYFQSFPSVLKMMLDSHEQAKTKGVVYNYFGRPRRMPEAMKIRQIYGNTKHSDLPYAARNLLNLSMNHRIQSTAASIMNRAAILCHSLIQELAMEDPLWAEVKIVLQVHDELVLECPEALADDCSKILKHSMESAVSLPGVDLIAEPKIANNLADLK